MAVRSKMFSSRELGVIEHFMAENLDRMRSFSAGGPGNARRVADLWQTLTDEVNSVGVAVRTVKQVKEKWRNMVSAMK